MSVQTMLLAAVVAAAAVLISGPFLFPSFIN